MNDENNKNDEENQNAAVPITDGEVPGPNSVQTVTALGGKTAEIEPVDRSVEEDCRRS